MTNQEILEKAIDQAIDAGWVIDDIRYSGEMSVESVYYWFDYDHGNLSENDVIWWHDFAKAIAGDEWTKFLCDLVVDPEPIKELAKWL